MGLLQRRKTAFATALLAGALALGCNESSRSGEAGGSERAGQQAKGATDTPVSAISTASRREIPPPPGTHGWPEPVLTLHLLPDKDGIKPPGIA